MIHGAKFVVELECNESSGSMDDFVDGTNFKDIRDILHSFQSTVSDSENTTNDWSSSGDDSHLMVAKAHLKTYPKGANQPFALSYYTSQAALPIHMNAAVTTTGIDTQVTSTPTGDDFQQFRQEL